MNSDENKPLNKEQIYDAQINPLMAQIIEICKANKIAMFATFNIETEECDDLACTTQTADETGKLPERIKQLSAIARGGRRDLPNPLMLTTQHADGSKTLTAIIG